MMTADYVKNLKRAYRTATEDNYAYLIQGIVCRLDIPAAHEVRFRKGFENVDAFKEQCKEFALSGQQVGNNS